MVKAANDHQLVVFIAGLMEPVGGDPSLPNVPSPDAPRYPPEPEAVIFARWIASRLSGDHVILSPGFDSPPVTSSGLDLLSRITAVGAQIANTAPRQLVTNHWSAKSLLSTAQSCNPPSYSNLGMDELHSQAWLDFHMYQSGTICDLSRVTNRARELSQQLDTLTVPPFRKVSVNGEATYDQGDSVDALNRNNRFRARHTAWLSSLTGAFGFTTGIGGVWDWGLCKQVTPNPCQQQFPPGWQSVTEGMSQPAAADMTSLRVIRSMLDQFPPVSNEQWRLTLNAGLPESKKQVLSRDFSKFLAYLPEGPSISVDFNGLTGDINLRKWYDPRDATIDARPASASCLTGVCVFENPARNNLLGEGDRVLWQPGQSVSGLSWVGESGDFVQAFEGRYAVEETWGIWGELYDANSSFVSGPVRISDPAVREARHPAVSRDAQGEFLVVWDADGNLDGVPEIRGRRLDRNGVPVGPEFEVSSGEAGENQRPSVALEAGGNAIVAWESLDASTGLKQVWIQRLDRANRPDGDPQRVGEPQDVWPGPKVAADPSGNTLLVWTEGDGRAGNQIVSLYLGRSGRVKNQVIASSMSSEVLALSKVVATRAGRFQVEWEAVDQGSSARRRARDYSTQGDPIGVERAAPSTLIGGEAP